MDKKTSIVRNKFHSDFLNKEMSFVVASTRDLDETRPLAVVFLNHCSGCTSDMWEEIDLYDSLVELNAGGERQFAFAAADYGDSGCADSSVTVSSEKVGGFDIDLGLYESFYMKEFLPRAMEPFSAFGTVKYIQGASMGGNVSLRLGLKHYPEFKKIVAHYPVLHHEHPADLKRLLFGGANPEDNDVFALCRDRRYPA